MIKKILFGLLFGSLLLTGFTYSQISFADFSFSEEFGSQGTSDDKFDMPTDLAISNNGKNLYIVDSENNRIKIYDLTSGDNCPSGTDDVIEDEVCFDDTFGSSGSSDGRFDIPTDLVVDPDTGDLYVVDSDNNRIQKFESDGDFDIEFGSDDSSDDDYLGSPSAIAVHKDSDYVYVADTTTDAISVFDKNGNFKFSFDDDDSNDEFKNPAGMVIDNKDDMLYVADTGNHRIRIFELTDGDNCPSGTDEVVEDEVCFVDDFGSSGSAEGRFDEPAGLAFDEDESILYVADTENNRIQSFEMVSGSTCPSGTDEIIDGVCFIEEFGSSGSADGKFNSPEGLAFDENNDLLYVADTENNRIQMISTVGDSSSISFSDKFGSQGTSDDKFDMPTDLAIDDSDNLYIVDSENNRIKIYDLTSGDNCPSGTDDVIEDEVCFDDTFGSSGSSDGRFDIPTDLVVDPDTGDLYVVDSDNNRIQKFESDGDFDIEFGSDDSSDDDYLGSPSAIAVHKDSDYVYVADTTTDAISVFDKNGNFKFSFDDDDSNDEFKNPAGMVIDNKDDMLYVADTGNHRIRIFELTDGDNCPSGTDEVVEDEVCFVDDFGSSGSAEGRFDEPAGLAFDEDESILYVADTENNRIQSFEMVSGSTCPSGTDEIIDGVCFIEEFGSSGSADGKFNSPEGLAFDENNDLLYVADTENNRIQILSLPTGSGSSSSGSSSSGSSNSSDELPSSPKNLSASAASHTSVIVTWTAPELDDDVPKITGYKIEAREGTGSYKTIVGDTKSTSTSFLHTGLEEGEDYRYKIYAINSEGIGSVASVGPAEPGPTQTPSGLTATAISKNQILLSWIPPTDTFKQAITGYLIEREIIEDVLYEDVTTVGSSRTSYTVSGLETDKEYSYVVTANLAVGNTPRSNSATATPETDSEPPSTSNAVTIPSEPRSVKALASSSQIQVSWSAPSSDGNSKITGYKIEVKRDSGSYSTLEDDTKTTSTSFIDSNVNINTKYTYRVSAINSVGTSGTSSEASATPEETILELSPIGNHTIDEKKRLTFTAKTTENLLDNVSFSLEKNPSGASINSNTGRFVWTPTDAQGGKSYNFDVVVKQGSKTDRQSITVTVNDVKAAPVTPPEPPTNEPEPPTELGIAAFVDETKDPQTYVDRYNNEPTYKKWFDDNYSEYTSIYQAVGLEEPVEIAVFVDPSQDPQTYVDRYNNEPTYKKWFDDNYSEYTSIYQAVGLEEPVEIAVFVDPSQDPQTYVDRYNNEPTYKKWFDDNYSEYTSIYQAVGLEEPTENDDVDKIGECGEGTSLVDGVCTPDNTSGGGGCLIATATYGSEMAPQVQFLREIRDNTVLSTESGMTFMTGFNQVYYSFSPYIADYERENPAFKELIKIGITPLLASLNVMSLADSESEILGYGIAVILMNLGMYVAAPAMLIYGINKTRKKVRF